MRWKQMWKYSKILQLIILEQILKFNSPLIGKMSVYKFLIEKLLKMKMEEFLKK